MNCSSMSARLSTGNGEKFMNKEETGIVAENSGLKEMVASALSQEGIPYTYINSGEIMEFLGILNSLQCVVIACTSETFLKQEFSGIRPFLQKKEKIICFGEEKLREAASFFDDEIAFIPYRSLISRMDKKNFCQELKGILQTRQSFSENRSLLIPGTESRCLVAVGASAGGPMAIQTVLSGLSANVCGILVVQHLTAGFSGQFAAYLNERCQVEVVEAGDGERVKNGFVYIAPAGKHMTVRKSGRGYILQCRPGPKVNGVCPSADCLMKSVAQEAGKNSMGIILTGMGEDGAEGLLSMSRAGAATIAQDQGTSTIYGMPRMAVLRGGAGRQMPLESIAAEIEKFGIKMNL